MSMDFCNLREIYPTNLEQILDTATKARLDSEKTASNEVSHKTAEATRVLTRNNIAERIVKRKHLPDLKTNIVLKKEKKY